MPKISDLKLKDGGLFRCCIATIEFLRIRDEEVKNGYEISCLYCKKKTMMVTEDTIQWNGKE